jgi:2-hydroxychromene-2-carboxylate isomerase
MAVATLDLWFEFASAYPYPAAMRIAPLAKVAGVAVHWRPFMLGPIFKAQGWTTSPFNLYPARGRNMWRDLERICGALQLPFVRPNLSPQNTLLAARVALVGLAEGWGEDYCRAICCVEFGEGRNVEETETITEVLTKLGQDAGTVLTRAQSAEIKSQASCKHRGGPVARYIWLPDFCHHQRRAVLGQ